MRRQLETFLLGGALDTSLSPAVIRANRLGAYAYRRAEGDLKAVYKADYLAATTRHGMIKSQLAPLIKVWRDAGIEVLLMKGFYLAEFVYEVAAERFYGDVDLLVHPEDVPRAKSLAEQSGWVVAWQREGSVRRKHSHEAFHLESKDGQLKLEIHRYPVQSFSVNQKCQTSITSNVWKRSRSLVWDDTTVRAMHPVDAFLVGLVLNRAWAQFGVKPHDLLDMRALIKRYGVTQEAVKARAVDLGCSETLRLFLRHCDPWEQQLDLFKVPPWQRLMYNLLVSNENDGLAVKRLNHKLWQGIMLLPHLWRVLPATLQMRRYLRTTKNLYDLLEQLDAVAVDSLKQVPREWLAISVQWVTRLAAPRSKGTCVLRSLVLYRAARERGDAPVFYSGVRRDQQGLIGHAWVEINGRPIPGFGDERARHLYKINFCYPSNAQLGAATEAFRG